MSIEDQENAIATAIDAGVGLANPHEIAPGLPYTVLVPEGAQQLTVRLPSSDPEHDAAPERPRGTYRPATVDAFIAVVERHQDADATTVWVHPTNGQIIAVFNDHFRDSHADKGPGWRDHRAQLNLTVTPEWRHWASQDGNLMSQAVFAEHVEDGLTEIVEPTAADMLELAQSFHAKQGATFRSAVRLQDGSVQAQYDEEIDAKAGRSGEMKIPSQFTLAIAPFLGEDPYKLTALLRYRVSAGKLSIGYKLSRPDTVVRDALNTIAETLGSRFQSVFIGEPGS